MSMGKRTYELDEEDFGTLCICALRYCQGRRTYMPSWVMEIVKPFLPVLSDKDIDIIVDDCERQRKFDLYGDDLVDKPEWLVWEETVRAEQRKRIEIANAHKVSIYRKAMDELERLQSKKQ